MKRFRFALQPVAVLRAHREMRAKENFAGAIRSLQAAEERLAAIRARVAQFEASLFDGRRTLFSAAEQAEALAAYRQERAVESEAEKVVDAARGVVEQRRTEYLEAHRKVEIVKRLEDQARALHRLAVNREEQAQFDEFAGRRVRRRSLPFSV